MNGKKQITPAEHRMQIAAYAAQRGDYVAYASVLKRILEEACATSFPDAQVQARAKTVSSFADKAARKHEKYPDAVNQFTDLCGARVIVNNRDEIKAICDYIESHFEIDRENSVTIEQRLKPSEFGYRSIHYIVQFKSEESFPYAIEETIPEKLFGLKAEIQLRMDL